MSTNGDKPGMTDAIANLVEEWGSELPGTRYTDTDGTPENARVSITPDEAIDLATRAYQIAKLRMSGGAS